MVAPSFRILSLFVQSEQDRLDHSTLKLKAKQELYEQYGGSLSASQEYALTS
jgi:hypothetical protein